MTEGLVRIKRGREKPIRNRHPWIFSGAIAHAECAVDGELVRVVDQRGRFLARGYWNSQSQIQVRILTWRDEAIDADWWQRMLGRAVRLRDQLGFASSQSACRLVNAESDFLPGLIIDRYADWYVLQALTRHVESRKRQIVEALAAVTGAEKVFERSDVDVRKREGLVPSTGLLLGSEPPELVEVTEDNATFLVDIKGGHKTGFYLDQSENRRPLAELIGRLADEANEPIKLLNLFSYSGAFAVAAGRFGELHSINVDGSRAALELAERTFARNGFDATVHGETAEFIQADCFDYLDYCAREAETFAVVVVDPPKFAGHKGHVERAARGYKHLNLHALKLVEPGGYLMTFSCSGAISRDLFQKIVFGALADSGRRAQILRHLSASADHPVALTFPEGEYLKGLLLHVF